MIPKLTKKQMRLEVGSRSFIQAVEVEERGIDIILHPSIQRGQIMYALPGGGTATEQQIIEEYGE